MAAFFAARTVAALRADFQCCLDNSFPQFGADHLAWTNAFVENVKSWRNRPEEAKSVKWEEEADTITAVARTTEGRSNAESYRTLRQWATEVRFSLVTVFP